MLGGWVDWWFGWFGGGGLDCWMVSKLLVVCHMPSPHASYPNRALVDWLLGGWNGLDIWMVGWGSGGRGGVKGAAS